ncbi:MAG: polysaccharide biosynthesis C-terminal domain-containing protein, partial [Acidobacteria bacterium]|nr:polysaccharide biosynthesis C-terminal domain-containing protein [Acidobacteriota bacterium]
FNVFIFFAIILFVHFFDLPLKKSDEVLLLLCAMPLVILLFDIMNTYFRASLRNREFSYFNITNTILFLVGTIVGGYFFQIPGIIAGRYLAFILVILLGFWLFRSEIKGIYGASRPAIKEKWDFIKYALTVALTNSLSQILYLLDVFLVGLIIPSEAVVASYKTATVIPFALAFVPQSIIMFIYPYFARNLGDKKKLKSYFYKIQGYLVIFNFFLSAGLIIFAPLIIRLAFGAQYLDAVLSFRILLAGYFISGSFRLLGGNVLASLRKVKFNLLNSTFSGVSNIVLNIILIRRLGSVGAAVATVAVLLLSSIASNVYLFLYFRKKDSDGMPTGKE